MDFKIGCHYYTRQGELVRITSKKKDNDSLFPIIGKYITGKYAGKYMQWRKNGQFKFPTAEGIDLKDDQDIIYIAADRNKILKCYFNQKAKNEN